MKQFCFNNEKIPFTATKSDLEKLLAEKRLLLDNYTDISNNLDDEVYISRGNGFCTSKWAAEVIDDKIALLTEQILQLEEWIRYYQF